MAVFDLFSTVFRFLLWFFDILNNFLLLINILRFTVIFSGFW